MIHFVVFFVAVTIIVIFLATKQRKPRDRFCLTAVALLCLLAVMSIVLLRGTDLFPAAAFALAALLLAHRSIVQFPSAEEVMPMDGGAGGIAPQSAGAGGRKDSEAMLPSAHHHHTNGDDKNGGNDVHHRRLRALRSVSSACVVQGGHDVSSHSTWIVAALVAGVVSACGW